MFAPKRKCIRLWTPKQTSMANPLQPAYAVDEFNSSATSSGTIAEASQNFTGCPDAQQAGPPRPKRRISDAAAEW